MKFLFIFGFINFYLMINAEPQINHFYIEENGNRCGLLDLNADLTVDYSTKTGRNIVTLNMRNASDNQYGNCSESPSETDVQFNITLTPTESLLFNFKNISNVVVLTAIEFNYTIPDDNLPNAGTIGTVSGISNTNVALSSTNKYYECKSPMKFELTNNITLNIYYIKAKLFNVQDNSFGNDKDECSQDFSSSSTSIIPTSLVTTKNALTTQTSTKAATTTPFTSESTTSSKTESTSTTTRTTASTQYTTPITTKSSTITTKSSEMTTHSILPIPTTQPPTDNFIFFVQDNITKVVCLIFKSQLEVKIRYQLKNNQVNETAFIIKSNSLNHGRCSPDQNNIIIEWLPGLSIDFIFTKQSTNSILSNVTTDYMLDPRYFPNALNPNKHIIAKVGYTNQFKMPIGNSYVCSNVTLSDGTNITIILAGFKYEAFRTSKDHDFTKQETSCDTRNPVVAIVVGVVLAGFLIIVVIIFLVFRYKAHKRKDYEEI